MVQRVAATVITSIFIVSLSAIVAPAFGWSDGDNSCYSKGNMLGSAGISFYHFGAFAAFDYGIHDCISAGVAAGYNGYENTPQDRINQIPLMARAAFHPLNLSVLADKIIIREMVDIYIGFSTGWVFRWQTTEFENLKRDYPSRYRFREYLGMRYHFTEKLAVFIEDCGEIANIASGITYKF